MVDNLAISGDALSQLIKLQLRRANVDARTTGNGQTDLANLINRIYNQELRVNEYVSLVSTIMKYIKDRLSEDDYGWCCAALMAARANVDLKELKPQAAVTA